MLLGKVLFEDVAMRTVEQLSVGERRRIELAVLFSSGPSLLLLDEPSNHLDLSTLDMLDEALAAYRGALLVATHDVWLRRRLAPDRCLRLEKGHLTAEVPLPV